jgi:hypothetical protein
MPEDMEKICGGEKEECLYFFLIFFPSGEITMACFYVIFTEIFKTQCSAMHIWLFDIRIQVFDKLFIFASRVMLYSLM